MTTLKLFDVRIHIGCGYALMTEQAKELTVAGLVLLGIFTFYMGSIILMTMAGIPSH